MTGVGLRRPSRVTGGHDLHPGIASMPGSQSILAALPDPLDTRSTTGEANPNSLAGAPFLRRVCVSPATRPGARSTQRWGLLIDGTGFASRISRFRISLRSELAGHPAQDCAESFGSKAPLIFGVRHEREGIMSKRLDQSSKELELSTHVEARAMLWAAVPKRAEDNRKSWLARAARLLGWGHRRTKAIFYCEARTITADEWRTLNHRLDALKAAERRHEEETHELRQAYRDVGLVRTPTIGASPLADDPLAESSPEGAGQERGA